MRASATALTAALAPKRPKKRKRKGGFDVNSVLDRPGEKPMSQAGAGALYLGAYAAGRKRLPRGKQTV